MKQCDLLLEPVWIYDSLFSKILPLCYLNISSSLMIDSQLQHHFWRFSIRRDYIILECSLMCVPVLPCVSEPYYTEPDQTNSVHSEICIFNFIYSLSFSILLGNSYCLPCEHQYIQTLNVSSLGKLSDLKGREALKLGWYFFLTWDFSEMCWPPPPPPPLNRNLKLFELGNFLSGLTP